MLENKLNFEKLKIGVLQRRHPDGMSLTELVKEIEHNAICLTLYSLCPDSSPDALNFENTLQERQTKLYKEIKSRQERYEPFGGRRES